MGLGGVDKILVVQLSVCQFWQKTGRIDKLAERPVDKKIVFRHTKKGAYEQLLES
jgi:hypothetical protein